MKIVSRLKEDELQLLRLREIIDEATGGAFSEKQLPEDIDLEGLITCVDITCASLLEVLDTAQHDNFTLSEQIDELEDMVENQNIQLAMIHDAVKGGVTFDESLDHAAVDFMEAMLASGAAEPTFDGEISFVQNVPLKKEDLKPMIALAIETWLSTKLA